MIKVTEKEMIDFIMAQPRDRPLNMYDNYANDKCGCVMVHYGQEKGFDFHGCGCNAWEKLDKANNSIIVAKLANNRLYYDFVKGSTKSYGEAQDKLKKMPVFFETYK